MACVCRAPNCLQGDGPIVQDPQSGERSGSLFVTRYTPRPAQGQGAPPAGRAAVRPGTTTQVRTRGQAVLRVLQQASDPFAGAVEIFTVGRCGTGARSCGSSFDPQGQVGQTPALHRDAQNYFFDSGVRLARWIHDHTGEVARVTPVPLWESADYHNDRGNGWGSRPFNVVMGTLQHRTATPLTGIAFLCHGDKTASMLGVGNGNAAELAAEVARHTDFAAPLRVAFLACLTGHGSPTDDNGDGGLAEKVCGKLIEQARSQEVAQPRIQVDGHYTAGPATTNPQLRRFYTPAMHASFALHASTQRAAGEAVVDPAPSGSGIAGVFRTNLALDAPGRGFTSAYRAVYTAGGYWMTAIYASIDRIWADSYATASGDLAAARPSWLAP